jgi:hypothetical protein
MMRTTQSFRLKSCALSPGVGVRTGMSVADLRQSFLDNLFCGLGRVPMAATPNDIYTALSSLPDVARYVHIHSDARDR